MLKNFHPAAFTHRAIVSGLTMLGWSTTVLCEEISCGVEIANGCSSDANVSNVNNDAKKCSVYGVPLLRCPGAGLGRSYLLEGRRNGRTQVEAGHDERSRCGSAYPNKMAADPSLAGVQLSGSEYRSCMQIRSQRLTRRKSWAASTCPAPFE